MIVAERTDLVKKGKSVSLESYSCGYDILSFDIDGAKSFIEVKTTGLKFGRKNFYLSLNDLYTAKELDNYYIYMVYDIISTNPRVWIMGNPFRPQNDDIQIKPIHFKVTINTKRK